MRHVRLGVLDVGSNTTRLLVADLKRGEIAPVAKVKVRLSLGEGWDSAIAVQRI